MENPLNFQTKKDDKKYMDFDTYCNKDLEFWWIGLEPVPPKLLEDLLMLGKFKEYGITERDPIFVKEFKISLQIWDGDNPNPLEYLCWFKQHQYDSGYSEFSWQSKLLLLAYLKGKNIKSLEWDFEVLNKYDHRDLKSIKEDLGWELENLLEKANQNQHATL